MQCGLVLEKAACNEANLRFEDRIAETPVLFPSGSQKVSYATVLPQRKVSLGFRVARVGVYTRCRKRKSLSLAMSNSWYT